eukprot:5851533-Amphidinium_carterae.1
MVRKQLQAGRHMIVECRASDMPVREEVMNDPEWQQLLQCFCFTRSCALDAKYGGGENASSCHGYVALASFPIPCMKCVHTCSRTRSETFVKHVLPSSYAHWVKHVVHSHKQHESKTETK